jgi:hypothetical protein
LYEIRGGRRKNDVIDDAAARVAALRGEANPVVTEDLTTVLALLAERCDNVITRRTRLINQLTRCCATCCPVTPTAAGIGPVIAGRLLGRTRRASRFASASAFVNYASLRSSRGDSGPCHPMGGPLRLTGGNLRGWLVETHKEVLVTDESQKANLPGPGETEGGRIDPSVIPEEAHENPELRVPQGPGTTAEVLG